MVRKKAEARDIKIDPVVRPLFVSVREPDMHDPASDFTRLAEALEAQWGVVGAHADLYVLRGLQKTLRKGEWQVTAAVRGNEVVGLYPGLQETLYGVAVDIGSNHHCRASLRPCDRRGARLLRPDESADPLRRRPDEPRLLCDDESGGEVEMTAAVRKALDDLIGAVAAEAGIARDTVAEVTIVGNPVMHHLFLGLDPTELGGAPFALTADRGQDMKAREVALSIAPGAYVYALPCIAGHVGADTAGVVLSEAPEGEEKISLSSMSVPMPRSSSATARGCLPAPRRQVLPLKGRSSPRGSALRPVRSSGCGSTARRWSHASR